MRYALRAGTPSLFAFFDKSSVILKQRKNNNGQNPPFSCWPSSLCSVSVVVCVGVLGWFDLPRVSVSSSALFCVSYQQKTFAHSRNLAAMCVSYSQPKGSDNCIGIIC